MKLFCVLVLTGLVCLLEAAPAEEKDSYTTKYDNIDLDEILSNERLYSKYFSCLADKGKCTPDGKELKDVLPDALKTGCKKCNERQKKGSEKVFMFLIEKKPEDFLTLEEIYDKEGEYRTKYAPEIEKRGLKIPPKRQSA